MIQFAPYEIDVLKRYTTGVLPNGLIDRVLLEGEFVALDFTGVGYYYTLRHSELLVERRVCDRPFLLGEWNDVQVCFVTFLQDRELTLECVTIGEYLLPEDFRNQPVGIRVQ